MSDALYRALVEEGLSGASLAQEYLRRLREGGPELGEMSPQPQGLTPVPPSDYSPEEELRGRLMAEAKATSYRQVATRYGMSATYIHRVVNGEKPVSEGLAERLGYRRVVMFERVAPGRRRCRHRGQDGGTDA